jgi:hypothetical protein
VISPPRPLFRIGRGFNTHLSVLWTLPGSFSIFDEVIHPSPILPPVNAEPAHLTVGMTADEIAATHGG